MLKNLRHWNYTNLVTQSNHSSPYFEQNQTKKILLNDNFIESLDHINYINPCG
jgi:hypothetical protein